MEKEFNVSIKPKTNSNENLNISEYLKEDIPMSVKESLVKSHIKKFLIEYLNVESKQQLYLDMISEIGKFIDDIPMQIYITDTSKIKMYILAKIIADNVYFTNTKYNYFRDLSDIEPYITENLLLLI